MNRFDEQLQELRRQMIRKEELKALLRDFYARQKALSPSLWELEERMKEEQADVDSLNRLSLSSVFYGMIGKREEKLCNERREAQEAVEQPREEANLLSEEESRSLDLQRRRNALQLQLRQAVDAENYEEAARLRDELRALPQ